MHHLAGSGSVRPAFQIKQLLCQNGGGFLINFITLIVGFGYPGRMRGGEHLGRSARDTEDAHDRRHHLVPDEPSLASLADELLAARPPFPPSLGLIEDWVSVHPRLLPLSSPVILEACRGLDSSCRPVRGACQETKRLIKGDVNCYGDPLLAFMARK